MIQSLFYCFAGWKPGSGSTNTMRVINAIDPKGTNLLAPITGITSVPSFNLIEGQNMSVPSSIASIDGDEPAKFF